MSTEIHLNPTRLSILSISRDKYWIFVSSIQQLLYKSIEIKSGGSSEFADDNDISEDDELNEYSSCGSGSGSNTFTDSDFLTKGAVDNSSKLCPQTPPTPPEEESDEDNFFHIALTPEECTVICSQKLMNQCFLQAVEVCSQLNYKDVQLLPETYLSLCVDSDGDTDASWRILELTKPLSENNISLFFISSYFNNVVLIPYVLKDRVVSILRRKNFEFLDISNSYIPAWGSSPIGTEFNFEQGSQFLEKQTFQMFHEEGIKPVINYRNPLLLTGSRTCDIHNTILKACKILSATNCIPSFFGITKADTQCSLLLPRSRKLRSQLGFESPYIMGSLLDTIIPISIDLSKLEINSTGIVAGLASKLSDTGLLYYLSMARSGVIMIPKENIGVVGEILKST